MLFSDSDLAFVWLSHSKSDLLLSFKKDTNEILLNQLCFHAQQSVEKALKAVLIKYQINFEFTHNIKNLIIALPNFIIRPDFFKELPILTDYAVTTRYPGDYEAIDLEDYDNSILLAEKTYNWAEIILKQ